jgi:hypothetical protein
MGAEGFVDDLGVDACGLEDLVSAEVRVLLEDEVLFKIGDGSISGLDVFFDFGVELVVIDFG